MSTLLRVAAIAISYWAIRRIERKRRLKRVRQEIAAEGWYVKDGHYVHA